MMKVLEPDPQAFEQAISDFDCRRRAVFEGLIRELSQRRGELGDAEFGRFFSQAQTVLGLADMDLARILAVSRPTISRWARGETSPHPIMAEAVFKKLIGLAKSELARLKKLRDR